MPARGPGNRKAVPEGRDGLWGVVTARGRAPTYQALPPEEYLLVYTQVTLNLPNDPVKGKGRTLIIHTVGRYANAKKN